MFNNHQNGIRRHIMHKHSCKSVNVQIQYDKISFINNHYFYRRHTFISWLSVLEMDCTAANALLVICRANQQAHVLYVH